MKQRKRDDGFRMSDALWQRIEPLLPAPKPHPLGCHRPRVSDRAAMDAILLVLRIGMQWNALNGTGICSCSCSSAYRRFREWIDAGVFAAFWRMGLLEYDELKGIDWSWLALDGAMTKAPLGGEKTGPSPCDRAKGGVKRSMLTEADGIPLAVEVAPANCHDMTGRLPVSVLSPRNAANTTLALKLPEWLRLVPFVILLLPYSAFRPRS
jgi:putative transposase